MNLFHFLLMQYVNVVCVCVFFPFKWMHEENFHFGVYRFVLFGNTTRLKWIELKWTNHIIIFCLQFFITFFSCVHLYLRYKLNLIGSWLNSKYEWMVIFLVWQLTEAHHRRCTQFQMKMKSYSYFWNEIRINITWIQYIAVIQVVIQFHRNS